LADDAITGNNSFSTAYLMGYWEYHGSTICKLEAGQNAAYFKFIASDGDRVYASVSVDSDEEGAIIETFNQNQHKIDEGSIVINPEIGIPFIYANADATSNGQYFYIKVTRGSYSGDMYFPVSINNRISSGNGTFSFTGTASNPGNPDILTNPNGVDSTIISMNLTNNSDIPNEAMVKSITTSSRISPSIRGITHRIFSSETNTWYTSTVSSSTSGYYNISLSDDLNVKRSWSFRYNATAMSASTMSNVKATISYEYDVTRQFNEN